jgi:hypothetical protein
VGAITTIPIAAQLWKAVREHGDQDVAAAHSPRLARPTTVSVPPASQPS